MQTETKMVRFSTENLHGKEHNSTWVQNENQVEMDFK